VHSFVIAILLDAGPHIVEFLVLDAIYLQTTNSKSTSIIY